jgi:hypothetical protein
VQVAEKSKSKEPFVVAASGAHATPPAYLEVRLADLLVRYDRTPTRDEVPIVCESSSSSSTTPADPREICTVVAIRRPIAATVQISRSPGSGRAWTRATSSGAASGSPPCCATRRRASG